MHLHSPLTLIVKALACPSQHHPYPHKSFYMHLETASLMQLCFRNCGVQAQQEISENSSGSTPKPGWSRATAHVGLMSWWMMLCACRYASPVAMSSAIKRPLPYLWYRTQELLRTCSLWISGRHAVSLIRLHQIIDSQQQFSGCSSICTSCLTICFKPKLNAHPARVYTALHSGAPPNSRSLLLPSSFCSSLNRSTPSHSSMTSMFCKQPPALSAILSHSIRQQNDGLLQNGCYQVCGLHILLGCHSRSIPYFSSRCSHNKKTHNISASRILPGKAR